MIEKRWITSPVDKEQVLALADSLALSPITAKVLWGSGVRDPGQARSWLTDSCGKGHDPFLLPDMEKCVDRLQQAIHQREQICFYGDYDVDGISATSLHLSFFGKMGAQAEVYIRVPGFISFASMACWHPTRPCAPRSCPARP